MKYLRCIGSSLTALALLIEPNVAMARTKRPQPLPTAPREVVNPYKPALECLASQLTPEQKATSIGVGYLLDRTGRDSYSQESAAGKFLGQAGDDMLITALAETGMKIVGFNPAFRQALDWQLPKMMAGGQPVMVTLPDILVEGSFSSLDFGSSNVRELYVFGIGGGTRAYHLRYSMDIRATSMPGGRIPGGEVLATLALEKDVIGRENRAGIASFFGTFGDSTYVEFNINTQKREMLQYSQRYMVSRAAFGIVADLWDITACNEILTYSDNIVSGQIQTARNIP
jgi:curli biogenesis system outer membrane secretion channel CsgG